MMHQHYLPSYYTDHDHACAELFDNRSLNALLFLIDQGRELEFQFHGQDFFLSRSGSAQYVSLWSSGTEESFSSNEEFLHKAVLQGIPFCTAWKDVQLQFLF